MKANCIEFKTTDGRKAFVVASEIESLHIGETGQCSLVSLRSGSYFHVDAKTATGLIELLGLIISGAESVNTAINVEVSTSTREQPFKNLFTHLPKPTIEFPYVYTAGWNDELLVGWLKELISKILSRESLPERIEFYEKEAASLNKELNQISSDIAISLIREAQDPTPHQGMAR